MAVLSSRAPASPSDVIEMIMSSGVKVHIIEDKGVDPVEVILLTEGADGSQNVIYSTTGPITLFKLTAMIGHLGYPTDYEIVL
jgi:hypothetical protein